jgi:hypothetical protein
MRSADHRGGNQKIEKAQTRKGLHRYREDLKVGSQGLESAKNIAVFKVE